MFTIVHAYVVLNQCHKKQQKTANKYTVVGIVICPAMIFAAQNLDGGYKCLLFSLFGEDSHFDTYFSNGLVQPPTGFNMNATTKRLPTFGSVSVRPGSCIDFIGTHSDGSGQTVVPA